MHVTPSLIKYIMILIFNIVKDYMHHICHIFEKKKILFLEYVTSNFFYNICSADINFIS